MTRLPTVDDLIREVRGQQDRCPACGSPDPRMHPKDAEGVITRCLHLFHRPAPPQAPAARPVNVEITSMEETVSLATDLHAAADRLDKLGEEAVTKLEAVAANPETAAVLDDLAVLATAVGIPAGYVADTAKALSVLRSAYASQQQAAPEQPADVPAGQ